MAGGYVYRKLLLERILDELRERPVVLWGPPGFGKTLLLREVARAKDLPYRQDWSPEAGVYDLKKPPAEWAAGQLLAMRRKPDVPQNVLLLGPEALAFTEEEAREMNRHLGAGRAWRRTWERLGGWPLLLRRAYESGAERPHEEPLRSWLKSFLARLTPVQRQTLELLRLAPSEQAAWRVLPPQELDTILARGLALPREGRLYLLPALANYLKETTALPPLREARRLLEAESEYGSREVALEGYLSYREPEAQKVFMEVAPEWNRSGEVAKTIGYWERLKEMEVDPAVYLPVAEAEYLSGRLEQALGLYRYAAGRMEDDEKLTEALLGVGTVLVRLGRYEQAEEAFSRAQVHATEPQRRRAEASLGGALIRGGKYEQAARVLRRASAVTQEAGQAKVEARAQHNLGIAYHHMGLMNEAIAAYRASLALRRDAPSLERANTMLSLGEALRLVGRWEEAHQVLRQANEVAEASGEYRALGYSRINLGDLYVEAGWLEDAEGSYQGALEILEPSQDRYGVGLVQLGLGRMYVRAGRPREAFWRYERALENLEEGGSSAELASVWISQAELLETQEALELLERAGAAAEKVGARRVALRARLETLIRRLPAIDPAEVEGAAAEVLALEALPFLLEPRYAPVWLSGYRSGNAGALVFERLVHGWGTVRFYTLGQDRVMRERAVEFFTRKEPWVLYALWLYGPQDADELAARVFPDAKNPRKRVQIAVHHVREALGDDWICFYGGVYHASPLPGSWWDAAVLDSVEESAERLPDWASGAVKAARKVLKRGDLLPGSPFGGGGHTLYF
ncbi:tetratricopeptide repeat protein [Oceanithermus sp.]